MVLEVRDSFLKVRNDGVADDDRRLCDRLLYDDQPILLDSLFDDNQFDDFVPNHQSRAIPLHCHPTHRNFTSAFPFSSSITVARVPFTFYRVRLS